MQVGRTPHVPASTIRRTGIARWGTRMVAAIACLVTGQVASAQQALGIITGTVTDVASGVPVAAARVLVSGTTNGTLTGDDGKYTLRQVNAGSITIEVNRIGYEASKATVTVTAGAPVTANVTLKAAVFSLQAVVTTVTGPQRKIELANTTASIDVSKKIAEAPVNSMGTLLSGRAAGVQVVSSGATGTGSRIRIRGQSSLSLNNDPLVYIDGVRMNSSSSSTAGAGGRDATSSSPSRFDDLNPAEIETIEVLKGPSASALYGTEAANGVINITTKKGKAGKTVWNAYSENGLINDPNKYSYPRQWYGYGATGTTGTVFECSLSALQDPRPANHCAKQDSLVNYSLLSNPLTTPLTQGTRQEYGIQVSGGSDKLQFFVAGDKQDETGVYKMPGFEMARLEAERNVSFLPTEQVRPNGLDRVNLRTNLTAQLTSRARVQLSSGYINSDQRQSVNENSNASLMVAYLGGNLALKTDGTLKTDSRGVPLYGIYSFPVGDIMSVPTTQNVNRFINSLAANWQTTDWLSTKSTVGLDYTSLNTRTTQLNGQGITGNNRVGNISNAKIILANYSADAGATASWTPLTWLSTKTSLGFQYYKVDNDRITGTGNDLPPGAQAITAAATRNGTSSTTETITFGTYFEEVLGLRDHVFLTGGVRLDDNSAFGSKFNGATYPHAGLSWAISDESWFPKADFLQSFRLRGSYGASGQAPGNTDALRYYAALAQTLSTGSSISGVQLSALGNPNLKPEFSAEGEGGFDLNMFNGATNVEVTYYSKATRDALIQRDIAPSLDGIQQQFANIGRVKNAGIEFTLNQRILDTRLAALTLNFNGSTTKNKLVTLGSGVSPIPTGDRNTQLNTTGYPLFGLWGRTYTYNDANHDGLINPGFAASATTAAVPAEITYSDSAKFIGTTYPKFEMAFSPNLELFDHKLRFNAQFDHKGGVMKFNDTHRHECTSVKSCQGWFDPNSSLADQAAAIAANSSAGILTGFYEKADFTRFRELSAAYQMPDKLAHYLRAERWNVILTGRNLHVWTQYKGVDPEATVGNGDSHGNEEYFSTPPLRYFTFRMNFTF